LARRDAAFLALLRQAVFEHASSPYARLCQLADCGYTDVERLVRATGVEGALRELVAAGVYLTVEEFKGRQPVVRGAVTIDAGPARLRNPMASRHVPAGSSGSRGAATHVHLGLGFVRDCAVDTLLHLDARGGATWRKATWESPGAGAMSGC
jgi:hypothetical protein